MQRRVLAQVVAASIAVVVGAAIYQNYLHRKGVTASEPISPKPPSVDTASDLVASANASRGKRPTTSHSARTHGSGEQRSLGSRRKDPSIGKRRQGDPPVGDCRRERPSRPARTPGRRQMTLPGAQIGKRWHQRVPTRPSGCGRRVENPNELKRGQQRCCHRWFAEKPDPAVSKITVKGRREPLTSRLLSRAAKIRSWLNSRACWPTVRTLSVGRQRETMARLEGEISTSACRWRIRLPNSSHGSGRRTCLIRRWY
jgi:hypothetical protein